MIKNPDYKASITASKGGKQLVSVITSTAFSGIIVVIAKELFDKDFNITDIKGAIESISGAMVIITPIISSIARMLGNIKNNYFKKI